MDLNYLPNKEKDIPVKFSLKESDEAQLREFCDFISEKKGERIEVQDVLLAMVKTELNKNKAFKSWQKRRESSLNTTSENTSFNSR